MILKYGNKFLEKPCAKVVTGDNVDDIIKKLFEEIDSQSLKWTSLGVAANQIGIDKSIAIARFDNKTETLINPEIIKLEEEYFVKEGCLSFEGVFATIKRFKKCTVKTLNPDGTERIIEADGLMAQVLQHETDHLNGILLNSHFDKLTNLLLEPKLRKIRGIKV